MTALRMDVQADGLVTFEFQGVQDREGGQQTDTAAGEDTFFNGSAYGGQCVLDAVLLFFQLDFGGSADLDDGHAADQLGLAFLQPSRGRSRTWSLRSGL